MNPFFKSIKYIEKLSRKYMEISEKVLIGLRR